MPYAIRSLGGGKYKVVNKETGNVHSKATSKANAQSQVRLLQGVEHGMKPRTTRQVIGDHPSAGNPHPKRKSKQHKK